MEILKVKMVLITSLVLLHFYVQPVVANSTVGSSTDGTSTIQSNITTMPMATLESTETPSTTLESTESLSTTLESTESPSTADKTSSTVAETNETSMTSTAKLTSSVSSSTPETTTQSTPTTTMPPSATIMTSTVLPSASETTPPSTMSPMNTTVAPNYTSPTMTTAGPGLATGKTEIIVICVAGGVMLLVLTIIAAFCIYKKCCTDTRPLRKLDDDDDFTTRMSMHRPESSTMNADGDLAFLTFTGMHNEVDGVVNPTYCTTIDTIPEGSATIPSKARLTQTSIEGKDGDGVDGDRDVEGAVDAPETGMEDVASEPPARIKQGEVRPISGVSYKSEDIDLALETLDVGTV